MAALFAGALVKTVPTNCGVPLRMWRMTVQEPDTSMRKPGSVSCSSGRGVARLDGDAKNCRGEGQVCVNVDPETLKTKRQEDKNSRLLPLSGR